MYYKEKVFDECWIIVNLSNFFMKQVIAIQHSSNTCWLQFKKIFMYKEILMTHSKNPNEPIIQEKLYSVYQKTVALMESIFSRKDESFDMDAIDSCVENILEVTSTSFNIFPIILQFISHIYTTSEHSTNVAFFVAIVGYKLNFNDEKRTALIYAALLHDIGKLSIDKQILDKPSFLEEYEIESVKEHSNIGCEILLKNGIKNQSILDGVKFHHERMDGSGYPSKIKGIRIPMIARIIGMCDAFDALTTQKTYRKSYSSFEALLLMKKEMKEQLDPKLIEIFILMHS